jgi:hypothetical protein
MATSKRMHHFLPWFRVFDSEQFSDICVSCKASVSEGTPPTSYTTYQTPNSPIPSDALK